MDRGSCADDGESTADLVPVTISKESMEKGSTKKNFCIFCKKMVTKLSRHFVTVHQYEEEVQEFINLPIKSLERIDKQKALRLKGAAEFNKHSDCSKKLVQTSNILICAFCGCKSGNLSRHFRDHHSEEDEVKAIRSLTVNSIDRKILMTKIADKGRELFPDKMDDTLLHRENLPCPSCTGLYSSLTLYRHYKKCTGGESSRNLKSAARKMLLMEQSKSISECPQLAEILSSMRQDAVRHAIENDSTLIHLGKKWCQKYETVLHSKVHVSNDLRQLGRFLLTVKKLDSDVKDFKDMFLPKFYDTIKDATKEMGRYDPVSKMFESPSVPSNLGMLLYKASKTIKVLYLMQSQKQHLKDLATWQSLYENDFSTSIGYCSRQQTKQKKWQKPKLLPLTSDIQKLNLYTSNVMESSIHNLSNTFSYNDWIKLAKATIVRIILFNRKRSCETERFFISDFEKRTRIEVNSEEYNQLLPVEKMVCSRFERMSFVGKKGKPTSCLLDSMMVKSINTILKFRNSAGAKTNNSYVFGTGEKTTIKAGKALHEMAVEAKLDNPYTITSTKLRKHIASISMAMNLSENELGILTDFMAHDINTHRTFYRQPTDVLHLAKMARLLLAIQKGDHTKLQDKSMNEINVNIEVEDDESDEYCEDDNTETQQLQLPEQIMEPQPSTSRCEPLPPSGMSADCWSEISVDQDDLESSFLSPTKDIKKRTGTKKSWKTPEKAAIRKYFSSFLARKCLPSLEACERVRRRCPSLTNRTPAQIKAKINNDIKSNR